MGVFKIKDFEISLETNEIFTIHASVDGGNGIISPELQTVSLNENIELIISPNDTYELDNLADNGADKTSEVQAGKYILSNIQEDHTIIVKFKHANSILEETLLGIKIHPNPTSGIVNIISKEKLYAYTVYDMQGSKMYSSIFNGLNQINLQNQSDGMYFINITTIKGNIFSIKVIKNQTLHVF